MNAFLVMGIGHVHDVPLALFDERSAALEFAEDVTAEDVSAAIREAWKEQAEDLDPVAVVLVPIEECVPGPYEPVKSFPSKQ